MLCALRNVLNHDKLFYFCATLTLLKIWDEYSCMSFAEQGLTEWSSCPDDKRDPHRNREGCVEGNLNVLQRVQLGYDELN